MKTDPFAELREAMVDVIAVHAELAKGETGRATIDPRVLAVMGKVPRHEFVPVELRQYAYVDHPLPIGCDKTISQPFICALMTDLLELRPEDTVLEIGTGLGYQSALLAELARKVYSVEIIEPLADEAKRRLARLGYGNVVLRTADGSRGWAEHAPFDKVIATAAPDLIPPPLIMQLKPGGRMVIPAGLADSQQLLLVEKDAGGRVKTKEMLRVRFSQLEGGEGA
jgi:protein-L-isoaspartate(D-aspartate) O-methyltransferase